MSACNSQPVARYGDPGPTFTSKPAARSGASTAGGEWMPQRDRSSVCRSRRRSSGCQVEALALASRGLSLKSRLRRLKRAETCKPSGEGGQPADQLMQTHSWPSPVVYQSCRSRCAPGMAQPGAPCSPGADSAWQSCGAGVQRQRHSPAGGHMYAELVTMDVVAKGTSFISESLCNLLPQLVAGCQSPL